MYVTFFKKFFKELWCARAQSTVQSAFPLHTLSQFVLNSYFQSCSPKVMWFPPRYRAGRRTELGTPASARQGGPRAHTCFSLGLTCYCSCYCHRFCSSFCHVVGWKTQNYLIHQPHFNNRSGGWHLKQVSTKNLVLRSQLSTRGRPVLKEVFAKEGSLPCVYLLSLCLLDPKFPCVPRKWWICIPSDHKCTLCCYFNISEIRMHLQSKTWHSLTVVSSFRERKIMDCLSTGGFWDSLAYDIQFQQGFPSDEQEKERAQNRESKSLPHSLETGSDCLEKSTPENRACSLFH